MIRLSRIGKSIILHDACVLINLLATDHINEIAAGCNATFALSARVREEALFLHDQSSGEKIPLDLEPYIKKGLLRVCEVETEQERLRFVQLATALDDGESECIAIAEARGFALATDDKKARTIIARENISVQLWSTCELLREWQKVGQVSHELMGEVLRKIATRARFQPKKSTPDDIWWQAFVSERGR